MWTKVKCPQNIQKWLQFHQPKSSVASKIISSCLWIDRWCAHRRWLLVTALSKSFAEKWSCSLNIITDPSTPHKLIWVVGANSFSIVQSTQTTNWGRGNYLSWISLHEHSRLISIASSNVYLCALDVCLIRIKNVTVEINKCLYMPASVLSQGQFPSWFSARK